MAQTFTSATGSPVPPIDLDQDVKNDPVMREGLYQATTAKAQAHAREIAKAAGADKKTAPKMHDGGVVQHDGLHNLQKGEIVLPRGNHMKDAKGLMAGLEEALEEKGEPKDNPKEEKSEKKSDKKSDKKPKHKHHKTEIEHHANGSHTVRHHIMPGADGMPQEPVSYAAPDMAALHAGMDANLGGGPAAPAASAEPEGVGAPGGQPPAAV